MKKLLNSLFFKQLVFSVAVVAAILLFMFISFYLHCSERLLTGALSDRARTVFGLCGDSLANALQAHDDIALLIQVERMMKLEDVSSVYILDSSGKVLIHDKTGEWGKTYIDDVSLKAAAAKKLISQRTRAGFLFSGPLTSSATLCMVFSSQKIDESVSSMNKKALVTGSIITIAAVLAFSWFIYFLVYPRFKTLRGGLASLALGGTGRLPESGEAGEFSELRALVNSVLEKNCPAAVDALPGTAWCNRQLIDAILETHSGGLLVIDENNKVLSLNGKAAEIIGAKKEDAAGKHVLDVVKLPALLELIKKASVTPGLVSEGNAAGGTVRVLAVAGTGEVISGIVLLFR